MKITVEEKNGIFNIFAQTPPSQQTHGVYIPTLFVLLGMTCAMRQENQVPKL